MPSPYADRAAALFASYEQAQADAARSTRIVNILAGCVIACGCIAAFSLFAFLPTV